MGQSPTLSETLEARRAAWASSLRLIEPGRVESYDKDTCEVSVQPLLQRERVDEFGEVQLRTQPIINHCPVLMAAGGGYGETFPIAVGDTVAIVWGSRSFDLWLARGGLVNPEDPRVNHINDAVVIPGFYSFASPRRGVPADRACFGKIGAGAHRLEVTDSEVLVGGGGLPHEPTIKATAYRSAEDTLLTALGVYATALGTALGPLAPAAVTLNTAITAFKAAAAAYVTTIAKVR